MRCCGSKLSVLKLNCEVFNFKNYVCSGQEIIQSNVEIMIQADGKCKCMLFFYKKILRKIMCCITL